MLKSIDIIGFKSFGKKVSISIDAPITAIVGPNGSGKSNVVEALRFVLGEQSIKSLRGKGSTDLLFKGSKTVSPANRLKVEIIFNNKNRTMRVGSETGKNISVDFDEVRIARELYQDGKSIYSIQGTEVRLKDISELLSSVHIGTSGHHIISQGEADKLLSASSKERRMMIDDALGLRIYEQRIRESERKLEKTRTHILEVESARRELAPHINFLKKQVDKISEAEEARRELSIRFNHYEKSLLGMLDARKTENQQELFRTEVNIKNIPEVFDNGENTEESKIREEIYTMESGKQAISVEYNMLLRAREGLERSLGKAEGLLEALSTPAKKNNNTNQNELVHIDKVQLQNLLESIEKEINGIENELVFSFALFTDIRSRINKSIAYFKEKFIMKDQEVELVTDNTGEVQRVIDLEKSIQSQIQENKNSAEILIKDEKDFAIKIEEKRKELESLQARLYSSRAEREKYLGIRNKLLSDLEHIQQDELLFDEEKKGFLPFLVLVDSSNKDVPPLSKDGLLNERRALERLRIKLEDIGGSSGSDIIKEYESSKERDEYLRRELVDLEESIAALKRLMSDLRETVREEFKTGIDKINARFGEFFSAMFGGGHAFVSFVAEYKKNDMENFDENLDSEESGPKFERGVEIHVDLPNKKVRDLSMLSGGERSLVSIALLFAMSQVNPPPFLVLDETDAALDEANSRRYGDMLEKLSSDTQLVVVTHNRETMSRAGSIYGVTMGAGDSVSRLLSIEFTEAEKIAK
jgi:chromosome segregation protein